MALAWAAGILAASLALALATRGPAPPADAKAKAQQLLNAGDKAAPTRPSAGAQRRGRRGSAQASTRSLSQL
jgi:hypothetical protein